MKIIKRTLIRLVFPFIKLYWLIFRPHCFGVNAILIFQNKILLCQNTYRPHLWSLPGGGVKKHEDLQLAISREIKEEVGLSGLKLKKVGTVEVFEEFTPNTVGVYTAVANSPDVVIDGVEIAKINWCTKSAIPKNLLPSSQAALKLYFSNK